MPNFALFLLLCFFMSMKYKYYEYTILVIGIFIAVILGFAYYTYQKR